MPFVEVPNVAKFDVVMSYLGQQMINGFHIKRETGWDTESLEEMCDVLIAFWNAEVSDYQATTCIYQLVRARDLTAEAGLVFEKAFPPVSTGVGATPGLPGNVAIAIKHTTGLAGRSYRGRTFLGGLFEGLVDGNSISAGNIGGIVTIWNVLDAAILAAGGTWGIVSLYEGYTQSPPKYKKVPTPRAEGIFTDIVGHSCDGFIDSQRRRLAGRGA